jgi:PHD/YefM family antitoxin component YafN of YafNO toxin-antitoxin module
MEAMTIRSEEARSQWRETIDAAYVDKKDVIIERYGKPVVTMVAHAKWQRILIRLAELEFAARAAKDYEDMRADPSLIVSEEEYDQILKREGLTV